MAGLTGRRILVPIGIVGAVAAAVIAVLVVFQPDNAVAAAIVAGAATVTAAALTVTFGRFQEQERVHEGSDLLGTRRDPPHMVWMAAAFRAPGR